MSRFEVSCKDFLNESTQLVDSTTETDSPCKKNNKPSKTQSKLARAMAAKARSKQIKDDYDSGSDHDTESLLLEIQHLRKQLDERKCKCIHQGYIEDFLFGGGGEREHL